MHKITFALFFLFFATLCHAQIQWQKCLGGTANDFAQSIQQTTDGGYVVAGITSSADGNVTGYNNAGDYWVAKLSATGSLLWQKCLGGSKGDQANAIQQTSDGGYIVAGLSFSVDGDITGHHGTTSYNDFWVVKLSASGSMQWQKSYGGNSYDVANTIQQTSDGGFIIAGTSKSVDGDLTGNQGGYDFWIVKTDGTGLIQWQKSLGGSNDDYASEIHQTSDGGYIVAGTTNSYNGDVTGSHSSGPSNNFEYWVVKLSSSGSIQWEKAYGGNGNDNATSIVPTTDGGYIVAGNSASNDGDVTGHHGGTGYTDCWIVKLSSTGAIQWQNSLGGGDDDTAFSVKQTVDGGYIVAGSTHSIDGDVAGIHGGGDCWLVKLSSTGSIQWQHCYGGLGKETATAIVQSSDNGYAFAGNTGSCEYDVSGCLGLVDYWVVKIAPETAVPQVNSTAEVHITPNPSNGVFTINLSSPETEQVHISVTDILGKKIKELDIQSNKETEIKLNAPAGIYFLNASTGNGRVTAKIEVE